MSFSFITAKRLAISNHAGSSKMIIRIAVIAVAVSLAVMLVSIAVVKGYKHEIKSKITGFSTHIQLSRLDLNNSFETSAIERDTFIERLIMECETVKGLQPFVIKAGIIKTKEDFKGIVLKGTDSLYDWGFIQQHLLEGKLPKYHSDSVSTNIIISKTIADLLKIKMGDRITIYFVQEPPRARRFTISGIFETGFGELDETYAYVDMRALQKLNDWVPDAITGYEINLKNDKFIDEAAKEIFEYIPYTVELRTIREMHPQLFEWLQLLDMNVWVIVILMIVVACINMTTALLILIVERSNMIGIIKTIGASHAQVRNIFLYVSFYLITYGIIMGNVIGIGLCFLQSRFSIVKLDQSAYYLSEVPILLEWQDIMWLNVGTLCVCLLTMLIPTMVISKINPVKVLKFD